MGKLVAAACSSVLKGARCIVDVHSSLGGADVDCSVEVGKKLKLLGAHVGKLKRLGKDTTHLIWLNGDRCVREAALRRSDVIIVGPHWVEACKQTATWVQEEKFFPTDKNTEQSVVKHKKRRQSMEPRDEDVFDEFTTPRKNKRAVGYILIYISLVCGPQFIMRRQAWKESRSRYQRSCGCLTLSRSVSFASIVRHHQNSIVRCTRWNTRCDTYFYVG
jgi:hypothetical protein